MFDFLYLNLVEWSFLILFLSVWKKKHAVLNDGIVIGKRKEPGSFIFLFQVYDFYVEACFHPNHKNIEEFRMFYRSTLLRFYLDNIRLDDLLH